MPWALIEVRREWSTDEEFAIIEAVHGALVRRSEFQPTTRTCVCSSMSPTGSRTRQRLGRPNTRLLVSIDCFDGRSIDAKRQLYSEIVGRLEPLGIPRDHVSITLRESPAENWGIRGGQAASDVDLGFKVNV